MITHLICCCGGSGFPCTKCCLPPTSITLDVALLKNDASPGVFSCTDTDLESSETRIFTYVSSEIHWVAGAPDGFFLVHRYEGAGAYGNLELFECALPESSMLDRAVRWGIRTVDVPSSLPTLEKSALEVSCGTTPIDHFTGTLPTFDSGPLSVCGSVVGSPDARAMTMQVSRTAAASAAHIPDPSPLRGSCGSCGPFEQEECPDLSAAAAAADGDEWVIGFKMLSNWQCCQQRVQDIPHPGPYPDTLVYPNRITLDPNPATELVGDVLTLPVVGEGTTSYAGDSSHYKMWAVQASAADFGLTIEYPHDLYPEPNENYPSCKPDQWTSEPPSEPIPGKLWAIICAMCTDPAKVHATDPAENCDTGTAPTCTSWMVTLMWIRGTATFDAQDMADALITGEPGYGGAFYQGSPNNLHPLFMDRWASATVASNLTGDPCENAYILDDGLHQMVANQWSSQNADYCLQYVYGENWWITADRCGGGEPFQGPLGVGITPPTVGQVVSKMGGNYTVTSVSLIGARSACCDYSTLPTFGEYTVIEACP